MIPPIENICTNVDNLGKDSQKIANYDFLWKLVAKVSSGNKLLVFILSIPEPYIYLLIFHYKNLPKDVLNF